MLSEKLNNFIRELPHTEAPGFCIKRKVVVL